MIAHPSQLEEIDATALLRRFVPGRRAAVSTAFGPGGACLLHLVQSLQLDVRVYFLDTRQHFPETLELLDRWRDRGFEIERITPDWSPELALGDGRLWARDPDRCCHLRKVLPNARALRAADLWITALRRAQPGRTGLPVHREVTLPGGQRITKLAPLAGWSTERVWETIRTHDLPVNPLLEQGFPSIGCAPCTERASGTAGNRDGRWAGRTKNECGLHQELVET